MKIHSPEFHRVWEVRFQVLRDPVPIEFALYRPSHLPFSGKSHNTIQMFSASGPMVVVPYYGHTSLQNLDYFHLLKALPTLNPQLPASYFEEKEFVYNIFAGIVRNIFYFETEENKRRVLSQVCASPLRVFTRPLHATPLNGSIDPNRHRQSALARRLLP